MWWAGCEVRIKTLKLALTNTVRYGIAITAEVKKRKVIVWKWPKKRSQTHEGVVWKMWRYPPKIWNISILLCAYRYRYVWSKAVTPGSKVVTPGMPIFGDLKDKKRIVTNECVTEYAFYQESHFSSSLIHRYCARKPTWKYVQNVCSFHHPFAQLNYTGTYYD